MLFELYYTRSVVIEPCASEDVNGNRTYGTPVTVPAIIDYTTKNIKDFRGNEYISSAWVCVPPDTVIAYNSRVTLPNGMQPYVGSITEAFDEEAGEVLYLEIYTGRVAPGEGML